VDNPVNKSFPLFKGGFSCKSTPALLYERRESPPFQRGIKGDLKPYKSTPALLYERRESPPFQRGVKGDLKPCKSTPALLYERRD